MRIKPRGLGNIGCGTIAMGVGEFGNAARIVRGRVVRIEADGFGQIRNRALEILLLDPAIADISRVAIVLYAAAHVIIASAIGDAADRLIEIGDGLLGIALGEERIGARFVTVDKIRIETQRRREVGDRRIELALGDFNQAAVVVGANVVLVNRERAGEVGLGTIKIAFGAPGGAAPIEDRTSPTA